MQHKVVQVRNNIIRAWVGHPNNRLVAQEMVKHKVKTNFIGLAGRDGNAPSPLHICHKYNWYSRFNFCGVQANRKKIVLPHSTIGI